MRRSPCCLALLAWAFLWCAPLMAQVTECGPPFTIEEEEIDLMVEALGKAIDAAVARVS